MGERVDGYKKLENREFQILYSPLQLQLIRQLEISINATVIPCYDGSQPQCSHIHQLTLEPCTNVLGSNMQNTLTCLSL